MSLLSKSYNLNVICNCKGEGDEGREQPKKPRNCDPIASSLPKPRVASTSSSNSKTVNERERRREGASGRKWWSGGMVEWESGREKAYSCLQQCGKVNETKTGC